MQHLPHPYLNFRQYLHRIAQLLRTVSIAQLASAMSEPNEEKISWSHSATSYLIELYRNHPVLYSTGNSDYKNRLKRLDALNEIRSAMAKKGKKMTVEDIKRKIHGLRTQYAHQLSKIKKNEDTKSRLWCFNQLEFLRSSYENQTEGEAVQEAKDPGQFSVYDNREVSFDDIVVKQESSSNSIEMSAFTTSSEVNNKESSQDDLTTFGKLVELELRKITSLQALRKAKKEIINILMDAQEACDNY